MTWVAAAILGSAAIGAYSSNKASNAQVQSADNATNLQRDIYQQQRADQQPFYQGGVSAENRMLDLLGLSSNQGAPGYGSLNKPFTYNDMTADPGYAFRLSEGLKGMNATAAARGGLISGSALKAGEQYGQAMGSQEYQNAFNRYQVQRSNILNPLQSLTGAGQTAANVMGSEGGQFGQSAGNNVMGAGNARASGYMGGANAITGGVGQYVNYMNNQDWMKALRPPGSVSNIPAGFGGSAADPWYG
jgi:hypothetical protein